MNLVHLANEGGWELLFKIRYSCLLSNLLRVIQIVVLGLILASLNGCDLSWMFQ